MNQRNGSNIGNTLFELKEIEKMSLKNEKECMDVREFTYGSGGVLTLICCKP